MNKISAAIFTLCICTAPALAQTGLVPPDWSCQLSPAEANAQMQEQLAEMDKRVAESKLPHDAVKIDPTLFDQYVGVYEVTPVGIFHFSRKGDHYFEQTTGTGIWSDGALNEIYPESKNRFFNKTLSQDYEFVKGSKGQVTGFNLLGPGDYFLKRVDPNDAAKQEAALKTRIKSHRASGEMAAALRQSVRGFMKGQPVYGDMIPGFADQTRQFVSYNSCLPDKLGALKSMKFENVNGIGTDTYEVTFKNTKTEWSIWPLTPDGKILAVMFHIGLYPPRNSKRLCGPLQCT